MNASLSTLCNDVLYDMLSDSPDLAQTLGIDEVAGRQLPSGRFPAFSEEAIERREEQVRGWARRLHGIATSDEPLGDRVTREALAFVLGRGFQFRYGGTDGHGLADHAEPVTPLGGVHAVAVEMFVRGKRFDTLADMADGVERLQRLPRAVDESVALLEARRRRGHVSPALVADRTIAGLRAVLATPPADHSMGRAFAERSRSLDPSRARVLQARVDALLAGDVRAAYARLIGELERQRAENCESISASRLARGEEWYAWRFAGHTTTAMLPDAAHELGLAELERVRGELSRELSHAGHRGELTVALASWAGCDAFPQGEAGRAEVLSVTRAACASARDGVRAAFGLWPRADVEIRQIAPEHEASQHSYYVPPPVGESGAGVFWLNGALAAAQPRGEAAILAYHEAWPGHHLQLSIAQQLDLPPLRRALLFNAYLEGWAKYAESLPETLDVGTDASVRIARFRSELYSTATLVLDTGVHVRGWTADVAREFFVRQTGVSDAFADMVVLRSASNPAQLCAYKIGLLRMRDLRRRWSHLHGAHGKLQHFHDTVLGSGALPLDVLERSVIESAARIEER